MRTCFLLQVGHSDLNVRHGQGNFDPQEAAEKAQDKAKEVAEDVADKADKAVDAVKDKVEK